MKRSLLLAALLSSSTAFAFAAEPIEVGSATHGAFDAPRAVARFTVKLEQGLDYAFGVEPYSGGRSDWTLTGPTGTVLCQWAVAEDFDGGCERRAGRDGWFTLTGRAGEAAGEFRVRVDHDCRGSVKSRCTIKPGQTRDRIGTFGTDKDWFKFQNLRRGRTYTVKIDPQRDGGYNLAIRNGDGRITAEVPGTTINFKAGQSAVYVEANLSDGLGPNSYHITILD